jgi:hypothetical protein
MSEKCVSSCGFSIRFDKGRDKKPKLKSKRYEIFFMGRINGIIVLKIRPLALFRG